MTWHLTRVVSAGLAVLLWGPSTAMAQTVGNAQSFAIIGGAAVNANGSGSLVNGDVGISPAAASFITGFPANATIASPFSNHGNDGTAIAGSVSALTLFNSAVMAPPGATDIGGNNLSIGGPTGNGHYTPGKYSNTVAGGVAIIPTSITLDGPGIYVFSLATGLTTSVGANVILNGVDPCTVFWRVPTQATLDGLQFSGNVVAGTLIAVGTGVAMTGRALTLAAGSVTLAGSDTIGGCSGGGAGSPGPGFPCPTITAIPNQVIPAVPANGSAVVNFTIGGSIITDALGVSVTSSNPTLVPQSAMVISKGAGGARVLTVVGADGRTGVSTITVTVNDPVAGCSTSTSFVITIGATAVPTLPEWAMIALAALLAVAGLTAVRRRPT